MIKSWKDLEVWNSSHKLTLEIYKLTSSFPKNEQYRLIDQLCRASSSIPTNIAEGKGRNSLKEYLRFLFIARGSIEETKYLLLLAKDLGYMPSSVYSLLEESYALLGRKLNALINSLKKRAANTQDLRPKT